MLRLNNIEVVYHNVILVLRGVSLELPDGGVTALLGPNGAGKTTTLKAISGLLYTEVGKIRRGTIEYNGRLIGGLGPEEIVRLGIVQAPAGRRLLEHLSVEEELKVAGYARGSITIQEDLEKVYNYFSRLRSLRKATSGYLSGGEGQMLVIGRALMAHPKVMLLDEPSSGLSPLLVEEVFKIMRAINADEGISLLLVEQNARAALTVAQYAYVMEMGRIVADGPADHLRESEDIKEFYLGMSEKGQRQSYREIKYYKRRKRWLG